MGLLVEREKYGRYAAYAIVGLVLPAVVVGVDRNLFIEFAEQVVYIGVAEEVFCRGYLMRRLCDWLGDRKGLVLGALIFGLSHVVSLVSQHGLKYPVRDVLMFAQTFMGGADSWNHLSEGEEHPTRIDPTRCREYVHLEDSGGVEWVR